jgi:ATP-binding protein involved in chromosome partitioning
MTSDVFGTGGGARLATELGVPFLGHVPLDAALRESSDLGEPLVVSQPESETARALIEIARSLDEARTGGFTRTLPLVS